MAININLYPPIVDTYIPAFLVDSDDESKNICKIYFSLSSYNSVDMIKNVQITVRNQYTNLSVLNKNLYPSEVLLTSLKEDISKTSDDRYYIELKKEDIQGNNFEINQYYKVQMRFTSVDASEVSLSTPQAIDTWLAANLNLFSEWSTVCLIRGISEPIFSAAGFTIGQSGITWSNLNPVLYGSLNFKNADETEKMKSYQIRLYKADGTLLTDSGLLYTDNFNNPNSFSYTFEYNFTAGDYYFNIEYTTLNLYNETTVNYTFTVEEDAADTLDISFAAAANEENGCIALTIKKSGEYTGTLKIRRTSSKSNFTIWEDIKDFKYNTVSSIKELWYDTTIESGVWYKYCLQQVETPAIKILKTPIMVIFDSMFLTTKERQLKIKFNPTVSSFKRTIQESRTDTIGSQFPFVRRNGYANYAQFPIGGLISFKIDEENLFTSLEELFGENLKLYTSYNDQNRITEDNNLVYEKLFRDKVIEFLYSEQPKLFRSATEGNLLVKIMDVSLAPNATLGRKIWSFTATAYEIAECSIENFKKYNILEGNDE